MDLQLTISVPGLAPFEKTLVRGTTVFQDGEIVSPPIGKLLRPTHGGNEPYYA